MSEKTWQEIEEKYEEMRKRFIFFSLRADMINYKNVGNVHLGERYVCWDYHYGEIFKDQNTYAIPLAVIIELLSDNGYTITPPEEKQNA